VSSEPKLESEPAHRRYNPVQERRRRLEECKREEAEAEAALEGASAAVLEVACQARRVQKSSVRQDAPKLPKPVARQYADLHHREQMEQERLEWELEWEA
jgi:hypothetical protein